jgi:antitoxin ParD1/3/4/toxin ParE1/3/4
MKPRYVLASEAVVDLVSIWRYIKLHASVAVADRVESVIKDRFVLLSTRSGLGHRRTDLTKADVKFYSVYSYLIVYRTNTVPLQIVCKLHGHQDVQRVVERRL